MKKLLLYTAVIMLIAACTSKREGIKSGKNLNQQDSGLLELNTVVYHVNDSSSVAYFEISNDNVLYKRSDTGSAFYAEVKISYSLTDEQDPKKVSDSSALIIADRSESDYVKTKILYAHTTVNARLGNNYLLEIEAVDINKKTRYTSAVHVNKLDHASAQNFLVTISDTVAFRKTFTRGKQVDVKYTKAITKEVTVNAYLKAFGPASPPFSTKAQEEIRFVPDSTFRVGFNDDKFSLTMPRSGFYHVQINSDLKQGIALFTTEENFPGVNSSEEMVNCTRYIMNREEFDECKNATDKKAAIDKFWLGVGGSNERARELLKRYYGRVKEANKHFTSYKEGWKTDRGMIFIVFGAPTNVYRSRKDETWVFGNEANPSSLRFIFNKAEDPFTDNDYVLERSVFYREAYYQAVDYWRQGNVFLENR